MAAFGIGFFEQKRAKQNEIINILCRNPRPKLAILAN
jgi:hypothetical protein